MDEDPSLLVVVLDASSTAWAHTQRRQLVSHQKQQQKQQHGTFQGTVEALLVFLQSYLLMHRRNDVAVVACGEQCSCFVYPTAAIEKEGVSMASGAVSSKRMQACIVEGLRECAAGQAVTPAAAESVSSNGDGAAAAPATAGRAPIARALSLALCYTHRKGVENPSVQTRIMVMQAGADLPESYNAIMNCIFSAQKAQIPVDCMCLGPESVFMQQAADITGGVYCHVAEHAAVLQQLLTLFLPSQACRKYLRQRGQESVDFRAACFCHRRLVEIAHVCSVCLSVFCEFSPICATCGTRAVPKHLPTR